MPNKFIFTKKILTFKSKLSAGLALAFSLCRLGFRQLGQFFLYSASVIPLQVFFHVFDKIRAISKKFKMYLLNFLYSIQDYLFSLSLRHLPYLHSFITKKLYNSAKYKQTFCLCICIIGGTIVVLGSLVGFVSYGDSSEIRRIVNTSLLLEDESNNSKYNWNNKKIPVSANYRSMVDFDNVLTSQKVVYGNEQANSMLVFSEQGIGFLNSTNDNSIDLVVDESNFVSILSFDGAQESMLLAGTLPSQYGEPLNERGHPLRWDASYSEASSNFKLTCFPSQDDNIGNSSMDRILLTQSQLFPNFKAKNLYERARLYKSYVEKYARRFRLSPDLVYAIIYNESNFVPVSVSPRSAMGLMQLMPETAGRDVHSFLYGYTTKLSANQLFDPETNINYGTAYLYLLLNRDLVEIKNKTKREYCAIASYNMGPNGFLRLFSRDRNKAIKIINNMSTQEILIRLTTKFPIIETRNYVARVVRSRSIFVNF